MNKLSALYQNADWKSEKHSPVIEVLKEIKKGEVIQIKVSVGKEIPHPNKTEHYIRSINVYFHPENEKFPVQIGYADFSSHGESINGPDSSTIYTSPEITINFKTEKNGTVFATSYCNIHGLWESSPYTIKF